MLRAMTVCDYCGNTATLGSFWQWLAASSVALTLSLGALFLQAPNSGPVAIAIALASAVIGFALVVAIFFRPVTFKRYVAGL